jgi:hypothetical protein
MAFRVATDDSRQYIRVVTTDDLTAEDISAILALRTGHKRSYRLRFDFVSGAPARSGDELRLIAARVSAAVDRDGPRGPTAIVASDDASFGMARLYATLCELGGVTNVRVFRTAGEAETWLSVPPPSTAPLT